MAAPAPLTKAKNRTTTQATLFDTYEVQIAGESGKGNVFEPRPRMAFDADDAVLALAETLKLQGATPEALDEVLAGGHTLIIVQVRLAEIDGKFYETFRLKSNQTHDSIIKRMVDYFPGANRVQGATAIPVVQQAEADDTPRMMNITNSGSTKLATTHPADKAPKQRRLITVQGGGGETGGQEALAELAAQLTPEAVKGGVVLVMTKQGPKMLSSASQHDPDDESGGEGAEVGEGGDLEGDYEGQDVQIIGAPVAAATPSAPRPTPKVAAEAPKPAKTVVTMTGDQAMKTMRATSVDRHTHEADSSLDMEMGGGGEDPGELKAFVFDQEQEQDVLDGTSVESRGRGKIKKQEGFVRKDRGNSARPVRKAATT
jgi:hypothetical protein